MRDLPSFFLDIINVHLSLFPSGYNLPVYDWREVEYYVYAKDILASVAWIVQVSEALIAHDIFAIVSTHVSI